MLAEELGCNEVVMGSDYLELIQACNGIIGIWSPYIKILEDCFQSAKGIGSVSFCHCPRDANRAAHNQARMFYYSKVVINWDADPLSYIIFYVTVI